MKTFAALAAALILSGSGAPAAAAAPAKKSPAPKAVEAVVKDTVNSVLEILKDKGTEREGKKDRVMAVVDPVFDFQLMAKLVLGRKHWTAFSSGQRKEFSDLFVKQLRDSYFEKVDILTDEKVEFEKPSEKGKRKAEMLTYIVSKDERYAMLYKLYRDADEKDWKVYDVEIEGISLVKSYGAQYDQFLSESSPKELLEKMRTKTLAPPKDLEEKAQKKKDGDGSGK